jgi:hypothetical protein
MKILLSILASIGLTMGIAGCTIVVPNDTSINTAATVSSGQSKTPGAASTHKWGARTKTSSCKASNGLQDAACTPGDILPDATKDMICVPGYSKSVRNVPASVKDDAYASYSIASRAAGEYEKDKVENWLHDHVCSGAMSLQDAQIMIATDWHQALNKMP